MLLSLALLCTFVPFASGAHYDTDIPYPVEGGNLYFDKTTAMIVDCDATVTKADIPAEIDGVAVTDIGFGAFDYCSALTAVTIPDSVTHIHELAFSECRSLVNVTFGEGLIYIGRKAFYNTALYNDESIRDRGVLYIENWLIHADKYSLIGAYEIRPGTTNLAAFAFSSCQNLTAVTIPDSVTKISESAFEGCTNLKNVSMPESITEIDRSAFFNCYDLASITIPDSVVNVGSYAFLDTAYYMDESNWSGSVLYLGKWLIATNADSLSAAYAIAPGTVGIADGAFFGCERLTKVTIPSGVRYICGSAFYLCGSLQEVIIPEGVISIGYDAFTLCSKLKRVVLPESLVSIGMSAFFACEKLTDIIIPDSVTYIGEQAFCECSALRRVYFKGDAPKLGKQVFCYYDNGLLDFAPIPGLTLYYIEGKEGWTSPTWNGYPTQTWFGYIDVQNSAWYAGAVKYALDNALMNGMSATTFEPESSMTRAMLVTVLWRYAGEVKEGTNSFTDVPNGQWYTDAIAWAAHNGIVGGVGNNKFDPDGKITREQMATILYRYAASNGIDTSASADLAAFPDGKQVSEYALDALRWAVAEGLINGSDGKLLPQGNATRAQVATILMRFIENVVK